MESATIFTNSLSRDLMEWLKEYSLRQKVTKRVVLEKALSEFRAKSKRQELEDSFKRAALDIDLKNMAEEGLGDYNNQLNLLDK